MLVWLSWNLVTNHIYVENMFVFVPTLLITEHHYENNLWKVDVNFDYNHAFRIYYVYLNNVFIHSFLTSASVCYLSYVSLNFEEQATADLGDTS